MTEKITANDLAQLLRNKYPTGQGYIVLEQVASGTGAYAHSWIDAAVFVIWPSLGLIRSAFEIKIDRGDFLAELQNPAKNEWARKCFHEFWFIAPKDVIKEEELPEGAGWMVPRGTSGLTIVRHAARKKDPTLDDVFLASLMRSIMKETAQLQHEQKEHIINSSHRYREAKMWEEAAKRLIKEKTGRIAFASTAGRAYEDLVKATLDAEAKQIKKQTIGVLDRFQDRMLQLFEVFALVAHIGILTKDEAMNYVIEAYGGENESSLKGIRKKLKEVPSHQVYQKERYKHLITLLELLEESSQSLLAEDN